MVHLYRCPRCARRRVTAAGDRRGARRLGTRRLVRVVVAVSDGRAVRADAPAARASATDIGLDTATAAFGASLPRGRAPGAQPGGLRDRRSRKLSTPGGHSSIPPLRAAGLVPMGRSALRRSGRDKFLADRGGRLAVGRRRWRGLAGWTVADRCPPCPATVPA